MKLARYNLRGYSSSVEYFDFSIGRSIDFLAAAMQETIGPEVSATLRDNIPYLVEQALLVKSD